MKKELRLYILIRNDLQSMSPGRCMAQAAHAANAVVHKFSTNINVRQWQKQTMQGFGTTIVLSASAEKIGELFTKTDLKKWSVKDWVTDPEYVIRVSHEVANLLHQNYDAKFCTFEFDYDLADEKTTAIVRAEMTCAYVLGTKEELAPFLGELPLY